MTALSSLAGQASSLYNAASQIFGLGGSVKLGPFTFKGIEVPETIKWGGKQKIIKQTLPGGTNIAFVMGVEFPPLQFSGIFEGFSALTRSRQLYTMLQSASTFKMSWNDRLYTVLIEDYQATDTQPNWIPYAITLNVLRDETLSATPAAPGLLAGIMADITSAIGITPATLTAVSGALATAQTAATAVGAVTSGSSAALALTGSLASAAGLAGGIIGAAGGSIGAIAASAASAGSVFPAGTALSGALNVLSSVTASGSMAAMTAVKGLLGRATTNLGNAST